MLQYKFFISKSVFYVDRVVATYNSSSVIANPKIAVSNLLLSFSKIIFIRIQNVFEQHKKKLKALNFFNIIVACTCARRVPKRAGTFTTRAQN